MSTKERELVRQFLATVAFGKGRSHRLVPTRANAQPAFGIYVRDPSTEVFDAIGLLVLTLAGRQIRELTAFEIGVLPWFGLPRIASWQVESCACQLCAGDTDPRDPGDGRIGAARRFRRRHPGKACKDHNQ